MRTRRDAPPAPAGPVIDCQDNHCEAAAASPVSPGWAPGLQNRSAGSARQTFSRVNTAETRPIRAVTSSVSPRICGVSRIGMPGEGLGRPVEAEAEHHGDHVRGARVEQGLLDDDPRKIAIGVSHRLERGVFGQMVAHVVGEDLVDHRRGHDRRDQHAEREQLAGRRLAHPVVRLAPEDLGPGIRHDVRRQEPAGGPGRPRRPSRASSRFNFRKPNCTRSVVGRSQSRAKFRSSQIATPSAAKPAQHRESADHPDRRPAHLPAVEPADQRPAEVEVRELVQQHAPRLA